MTGRRGTVPVLVTLAVALPATGFRDGGAFRNVGITFTCPKAICIVRPDGTDRSVFVMTPYDGAGEPSWSRDGRILAFYGRSVDTWKIVIFPLARRQIDERGTPDSRSSQPSWSPDGRSLAVTEDWGARGIAHPESTIKILSIVTNRYRRVTTPVRRQVDDQPAWSPDGRTIAFVRQHWDGRPMIYVVRPDGGDLRPLVQGTSPSWSPDGRRIAFARNGAVYISRSDGTGRRRVVGGLREPRVRWSPDGRKLLYTTLRADLWADVWTAAPDGSGRKRVLAHVVGDASWRPGAG